MTVEALETSKWVFLAFSFLLIADNDRYGEVKAVLGNSYLLGKQEYTSDLLAVKRLLADFKDAGKPKKRGSNKGDATGNAIAKQESKWTIVCHGCGAAAQEDDGSAPTSRRTTVRGTRS